MRTDRMPVSKRVGNVKNDDTDRLLLTMAATFEREATAREMVGRFEPKPLPISASALNLCIAGSLRYAPFARGPQTRGAA